VAAARPSPAASTARARELAEQQCLAERVATSRLPALPLPATAEPALRAQLLGRVKAAPVLFLSEPPAAVEPALAGALRRELEASPGYETFNRVVGKVRSEPALARAVFLRDGYLYTASPELATLFGTLTLSVLFRDPELLLTRGAQELSARRLDDGDYEYTSGPERGRRARLLLFDRVVSAKVGLSEPRHVDLQPLAQSLGFDELVVLHASSERLVVDLVYGSLRVPALLHVERHGVRLACEAPGADRAELQARRAQTLREHSLQTRILDVIREQVDEGLPFDEPKTEDGQQDGQLRPEWRQAYLNGRSSFEFNGDRYAVFDGSGRPRPPQVCIDFVLDTFERASGSWWQVRGQPPQRTAGRLSFDEAAMANRRSVERFVEFARERSAEFDVLQLAPEQRVPLRNRQQFFATIYGQREQFRRGDIVAILGPRDDEKLHYHSFFIVATDPLSGMPTELAANAGRPRIRSWEGEMSNAPRRSIWARVRPRGAWLESFLGPSNDASAEAPVGAGAEPTAG
jgi:hypothetical protein